MFGHAIMVGRPPKNNNTSTDKNTDKDKELMKTWKMTITYLPRRNVRWQANLNDEEFEKFSDSIAAFCIYDKLNNNAYTKLTRDILDQCSLTFEKIEVKK